MNDVLARAAGDFEDDALCRQDIPKDTENEIAIAKCCRGILTGVVHHPHAFPELGPQNSRLGKCRRNRKMSAHWCCRRPRAFGLELHRDLSVFKGHSMRDALLSRNPCPTSKAVALEGISPEVGVADPAAHRVLPPHA